MTFLYIVIGLVLVFDFINGFHDSANSIATVVSTKVLSPVTAVFFAAFFNFIAYFVFTSHKVAATIGKGIVNPEVINLYVIAAALIAAIAWNLLTWWWGLPSSSSHTLVGGLVGAAITKSGFGVVIFGGVFKIVIFIVIAPLMGMVMAFLISSLILNLFKRFSPKKVDKFFRSMQVLSASAFSLGHGGNDAQKSIGIIWVAVIVTSHKITKAPESWMVIACYSAIALGTMFGGWRIVKTMGQKITKLKPFEGFCAETAGALTLFGATEFGIPVSTTHTITGAIMGVGAQKGLSAVRWGVTRKIFWAWILTIPISAIIGAVIYLIISLKI
jgi:inorganic phosphate transporter, PiT family